MEANKEKIQWHPAFCSATELEFIEDRENLEFKREFPLSKQPLKIDLMVIKKKPNVELKNEIGHLFKNHNIIEYKSPDDDLNIDDYYKTMGYACLYKAFGKHVDEIPYNELTISFFYDKMPDKLMNQLKESGHRIKESFKGIFYVEGNIALPKQQIVVTSVCDGTKHLCLKSISNSFTEKEVKALINEFIKLKSEAKKANDSETISNLNSLLYVSFLSHLGMYANIRKGDSVMNDVILDFFKDDIDEKIIKELSKYKAQAAHMQAIQAAQIARISELEAQLAAYKAKYGE